MSAVKQVDFSIKPLHKTDKYFGFSLEDDPMYLMPDGTVFHNSGKSVTEQSIVGHVSRYSDRFQLVGVDCKRVEFNLLRGVKGVKGVALDVPTAADAVANFQKIMMDRFKFMEQMQVNNVYKIKDKEVNYYEVMGQKVQFDEIYELMVDLDESDRNYSKMKQIYPDGRQPIITTIENIYNGMHEGKWDGRHPQLPEVKGYNSYIDKNSIRMCKGIYTPKVLLFLADELNELMTSDDYKSVDIVKGALGSIARLGRAAAVHLALACQRASGSTISTDLKNNIQMSVLLGGFDDGASQLMFEKDISQLAKPQIKGRGFIGSGNEIIETQTYYTQPENDWEFDEDQKLSYNNPVFIELCKRRGKNFDELNTGWVPQHPLDEEPAEEEEEFDEEPEDDEDDEVDEAMLFSRPSNRKKEEKSDKSERPTPARDRGREKPPKPEKSNDENVTFTFNKPKSEKPVDASKVGAPEIDMSDIEAMFGPSETPTNSSPAPAAAPNIQQSNRDRISGALNSAPGGGTPKVKLNIDRTTADQPIAPTSTPTRIKLNIKPKNQDTQ